MEDETGIERERERDREGRRQEEREKRKRGGLPSEGRERPYFYGRLQSRGRKRDKCGR